MLCKRVLSSVISMLFVCGISLQSVGRTIAQTETSKGNNARMQWWRDARFGMFIHWGIYAVPAEGEWYMTTAHIPRAQYEKYAEQFDPVDFNADRWAEIAHDAGMKYLVITSKHHDGFCMFRTRTTRYNVVDATPWGKDPLAALSEACRRYGIHFGVYYSIMDWHSPNQGAANPDQRHPDYNPTHFKPSKKNAYVRYMKTQLKELVTQYHPEIIWFDGGWMNGWTDKDGREIYDYLRRLDPNLIINNRAKGSGDYETPEQQIPADGLPGHDWETCMTINNNWGYNASDCNFKSVENLLHNLIDIVSKGGNYLLNVGPTADGVVPQPEVDRLEAMGKWLKMNGESVYGTTASPFARQLPWGRCTQKQDKLYFSVFDWPEDGKLIVHGLHSEPQMASLLSVKGRVSLEVSREGDGVVITVPSTAPDTISSVVELDFYGRPIIYNPPELKSETNMFIDSLDVNVEPGAEGAEARYTSDGSIPTAESPVMKGTIKLAGTTVVTSRYFRDGKAVSEITQSVFTKVKPEKAVKPVGLAGGIQYKYFGGSWQSIPDFTVLTPEREGVLTNFVLPSQRSMVDYGVVYTGYIRIPKEDVYTFYTSSDDGSKLYIGNKLVVDNDGLHGVNEKKGVVALSAGYHPVRVEFFQGAGDQDLSVYYESPVIKKRLIPDTQLYFKK